MSVNGEEVGAAAAEAADPTPSVPYVPPAKRAAPSIADCATMAWNDASAQRDMYEGARAYGLPTGTEFLTRASALERLAHMADCVAQCEPEFVELLKRKRIRSRFPQNP